jgi:hypothetical protein
MKTKPKITIIAQFYITDINSMIIQIKQSCGLRGLAFMHWDAMLKFKSYMYKPLKKWSSIIKISIIELRSSKQHEIWIRASGLVLI